MKKIIRNILMGVFLPFFPGYAIKLDCSLSDISPFALNSEDTIINYRNKSKNNPYGLTKEQYRELVELTIPIF